MNNATYYVTRAIAVAAVGGIVFAAGSVLNSAGEVCLLCPPENSGGVGDPGMEGADPSEGGFGPEIDPISAGGGAVDPTEMGGLDSTGADPSSGDLDNCAVGECDDGGSFFDFIRGFLNGDLNICIFGACAVDPEAPDELNDWGEGDVDNCQISATCETGDDDSTGQDTGEADDGDCDDEDDDERCEQDNESVGQTVGQTPDTPDDESQPQTQSDTDYPDLPDTDDGVPDPDEVECEGGVCTQLRDTDGDGWIDVLEEAHPGDPLDPDCIPFDADCDGWGDINEIELGTDPNDPDDHPELDWLDGKEDSGDGWDPAEETEYYEPEPADPSYDPGSDPDDSDKKEKPGSDPDSKPEDKKEEKP